MWKGILLTLLLLLLAAVGGAVFLGVQSLHPEITKPDLKQEFGVTGVTVGLSTSSEISARFGPPERQRSEHSGDLFQYPSRGLLFRTDKATGAIVWYEFTSPEFATGRGIRIGTPLAEIMQAYGPDAETAVISGRTRLRYTYGTAYALEFWMGPQNRLEKVVFFKAR